MQLESSAPLPAISAQVAAVMVTVIILIIVLQRADHLHYKSEKSKQSDE